MSTSLRPIITDAGIQALMNESGPGVKAKISHVAVGDGDQGNGSGPYEANKEMIALKNEIQRVAVAGGELIGNLQNQLHLAATIQDRGIEVPEVYPIFEIGFFLETGELFAVYSSTKEKLAEKIAGTDFVLAFDLTLTGDEAKEVVVDGSANLEMPIARDNLLMGENTVKIHTQLEFDNIFNQGSDTVIPANLTIVLSPIQQTTEGDLSNGAWGGMGDEPQNTFNGRPAYILKNPVFIKSNVTIIGFNLHDTIVVKAHSEARFSLDSPGSQRIRGVKFSGWSFDGRGGLEGFGGDISTPFDGGAMKLSGVEDCVLNCMIINHKAAKEGPAIGGLDRVQRIEAKYLHVNKGRGEDVIKGCKNSEIRLLAGGKAVDCENSVVNDLNGELLVAKSTRFDEGSSVDFNSEVNVHGRITFNQSAKFKNQATFESGLTSSNTINTESVKVNDNIQVNSSIGVGVGLHNKELSEPFMISGGDDFGSVGITQNLFSDTKAIELTTEDNAGNQAARVSIRGGQDSTDIHFLKGARDSESTNVIIKGVNGDVGIGTENPESKLDVNGSINAESINTNSGFNVNGEKPFVYKRFSVSGGSSKNTNMSTEKYVAAVVGFSAGRTNIDDDSVGFYCYVRPHSIAKTWRIYCDIKSYSDNESWTVDVLFINKSLVSMG
ncbi:phage tail protein [Marinibactrum halimedae]|uniref:Phage tail fibre protein N-terminal domain-containing protein n=1 Tax=Marinibactrum halimedae TaxID=1444977 RepID=A0AA37T542_9GAMM|nr:phage tail protein [Marinibactrum halimedae]MCD9460781.1 phage tail protein [Marinibactrum halimedae]GLS27368.1 hypothetical protein GCM10007877_30870 [Marinibactrum halimedae]